MRRIRRSIRCRSSSEPSLADTFSQLRQICVEEKYTIEIPTRVVT